LRLYRLDTLGTFRSDQATELSGARQILAGKLTLIGIKTSNSEVRNGAVMYYLLAPVLRMFNFDPVAGGVLQTGLQLATIILVFGLYWYSGQSRKGLAAGFLLAFSPLLVRYSRQTLLAYYPLFFDTLALCLMTLILTKNRKWFAVALGIVLGIGFQIHYSVMVMAGVAAILPGLFRRKIPVWFYYPLLAAGFVAGFSPMIAFELRHEFFNTKMLLALFSGGTGGSGNPFSVLVPFWSEAVGRFLAGNNTYLGFACLAGLIAAIIRFRKLTILERLAWWILVVTILFTAVFARGASSQFVTISHYALSAFVPIIILLVSRPWPKTLAVFAAGVFLVINLPAMGLLENHGASMHENWTLAKVRLAAQIISANNTGEKYNVAMLVDSENQALPLRYFLDFSPNGPLPVWDYGGADHLFVVAEPGLPEDRMNIWEVSSFGPRQILESWDLDRKSVV
jgi:4-amino-4-deoxy-L-arabinose transferase-like glycosyltransferase